MDIERGYVEILFKRIPYSSLSLPTKLNKSSLQNVLHVTKDLFLKHAKDQFPYYSNNELTNIYDSLYSYVGAANNQKDIFDYLCMVSGFLLNTASKEPTCKYEQLLRWRESSFVLGQDIFTTSLLAKEDVLNNVDRKFFSWRPILRTDNDRLHNVLNQGMAENHFHINGSSQNFILNWISIMNNVVIIKMDVTKLLKRLSSTQSEDSREHKTKSIFDKLRLAAYYRCYLFACNENDELKERINEMQLNEKDEIGVYTRELQNIIDILKYCYGYKLHDEQEFHAKSIKEDIPVIDYCITNEIGNFNNDSHNRVLAGERNFLYTCFRRIYNGDMKNDIDGDKQKLFFWKYLAIKSEFRSELVQLNGSVGFDNFSQYQNRKTVFIKTDHLKKELIKLAIGSTCIDQNIKSLEGRLMCEAIKDTRKKINDISKDYLGEEVELFLVVHFPKTKSTKYCTPKNAQCRTNTMKKANKLYQLLNDEHKQLYKDNDRIRIKGIDACSNEIGCRPEVFAQTYRFLLNEVKTSTKHKKSIKLGYNSEEVGSLKATYHAGEDFLDISDGLRAIDEVLLFCGYKRDFRIGHALALGINASEYYKSKHYKLILPKQDAFDNVVWMMERSVELGIEMDATLKGELSHHFSNWSSDIYGLRVNSNKAHQEISACECFNAWKLRGDNPEIYKKAGDSFLQYLNIEELDKFEKYNLNDAIDNSIRKKYRHRELYFRYHFDVSVQKQGSEMVTFEISQSYIKHIEKLQDAMIHLLVKKGIGIECNPSSNFLIGTINRYNEHPILRFQPIKQEGNYPGRLSASINTDDQGVFDTYLENEYALMAYALQKSYEKEEDVLYDVEDIYDWIDHIRKLGLQQKF